MSGFNKPTPIRLNRFSRRRRLLRGLRAWEESQSEQAGAEATSLPEETENPAESSELLPSEQPSPAHPEERQVVRFPQVPSQSRRNAADLFDSKPICGTDGMNRLRSWLHHPQSRIWMFVGDETTAWQRYHGEPGYAEVFRHRIRWEMRRFPDVIINAGLREATFPDLEKITFQGLSQCHPDAVFIMPGYRDAEVAMKFPFEYSEDLRQFAAEIRRRGSEPLFQTPPVPRSENMEAVLPLQHLADLVREISITEGFPLIDHAEFWQEQAEESWWLEDRKTVSAAGQRALSMLFLSELDLFDRSSPLCDSLQQSWNASEKPQTIAPLSIRP